MTRLRTEWAITTTLYVMAQVMLSGDFVPHLAHGEMVSRPLRPPRSRGSGNNLAARGSLRFQLCLRRGGESLASEFVDSAVTVETLTAKGLPYREGRYVKGVADAICFIFLVALVWFAIFLWSYLEAPWSQKTTTHRSLCLDHEDTVVFCWLTTNGAVVLGSARCIWR